MQTRFPNTPAQIGRLFVAAVYLTGSFTHFVIALLSPQLYDDFGAWAPITTPAFRDIWTTMVLPNATALGLIVGAGELVIALLVMRGGSQARLGLAGAIAFHAVLAGFFGIWPYAVPAIVGLAILMRYDFEAAIGRRARASTPAIGRMTAHQERDAAGIRHKDVA
ncbi:MAG: hypothetical protein WD646_05310 [Actinomycetota bacterium]